MTSTPLLKHTHTHTHTQTHTHTHSHTHTHIYIYIYIYMCMYVCKIIAQKWHTKIMKSANKRDKKVTTTTVRLIMHKWWE